MCDPFTAMLAAAATVASSTMSGIAQSNQVKAQNQLQEQAMARSKKMREEEQARQDKMRDKNAGVLDETIDRYDPNAQLKQLQEVQDERVDSSQGFADSVAKMTPDEVAIPTSNQGNSVVSNDLAQRLARASAESRARIAAYAKLGGYDANFAKNTLADQNANRQINLTNNIRGGSLAASQAGISLVNSNVGTAAKSNSVIPAAVGGLGKIISAGGFG